MSSFADRVRSRVPRAQPALSTEALTTVKHDTELAEVMNLAQNIAYGNNLDANIDVIANSRFIAIVIHHYIAKMYASTNYKEHPLVSPPSLMAYCLALVNGFHLLSDVIERQPMSPSAQNFVALPQNQDLFEILADCMVPTFLAPIIAALLPFSSPQRPGLKFSATFACFHPDYDLPHIMTPGLFFQAHNVLSNSPLNATPAQIAADWFSQTVITLPAPIGSWNVGQLLGCATDTTDQATQLNVYHNWLSQRMTSLFNPVTSRYNAARPILAEIPFIAPTHTDINTFNPYEYALGLNRQNRSFVFSFLRSVSTYVKTELKANVTLTQVVDNASGNQIIAHMLFPPSLPTWHHKEMTSRVGLTKINQKTAEDFAKLIKFLDEQIPAPTTAVKFPKDEDYDKQLYTAENVTYDYKNDPNQRIRFDPDRHVTPDMHIFNPITSVPSSQYGPICAGLMIENGPIDGFALPLPNIERPIGLNNMEFLQGTIVLEDTQSISHGIANGYHPIARIRPTSRIQKIATALFDMAIVRVPRLTNTITAAASTSNIGFKYVSGICEQKLGFTWFGHASDKDSSIASNTIHLWSSYRYLRNEQAFDFTAHHASAKDILVFCSLRGLFGTEVILGQTRHPSELIQ